MSLCYFVLTVFIGFPFCVVVGLVIIAPIEGVEWLSTRWRERHGPRRPSILMAWLRAKKRRVCPLVEFD